MLNFHIIIPARFHSTRLANKLMRPIGDKILLQYTYEHALLAGAKSVTIATDDARIFDAMQNLNAPVVMTHQHHQTGTDRLAETVDILGLADDALVVNIQGDEPLMPACLVHQVVRNLSQHHAATLATLCEPIHTQTDLNDSSVVKVVRNHHDFALYFSRAVIPFDRDQTLQQNALAHYYFRHLGLYAYRAHFLRIYPKLTPAPMEQIEKLEQLRALYSGYQIHVDLAEAHCPPGVDIDTDLEKITEILNATTQF